MPPTPDSITPNNPTDMKQEKTRYLDTEGAAEQRKEAHHG